MSQCSACNETLNPNESFCGECGAPVPAEDPGNVAKYEAAAERYMADGLLEDWEKKDLERLRSKYAISQDTHNRIMSNFEIAGHKVVELKIDESSIEEFEVSQRCLFRLLIGNQVDAPLVDTQVSYRIEQDGELLRTNTDPIPPGQSRTANLKFVPAQRGHYQLQALIVASDIEGSIYRYRTEVLAFKVGEGAHNLQNVTYNIDASGQRASMIDIGDANAPASKTGGVLGDARWRTLNVSAVSAEETARWLNEEPASSGQSEASDKLTWECPAEWKSGTSYKTARLRWRKAGSTHTTHLIPRATVHGGKSHELDIHLHLKPDGDVPGTEAYKLTNQISRKHFTLRYEGDRVRCMDMGSTFGTYHSASGDLEARRPTTLRDGDRIILSPKAPGHGHRLTGTDGIIELRVGLGQRTQPTPLSQQDEESVRRSLDDAQALNDILVGPDKPGRLDWVRLNRVGNGPDEEYIMHLGAVTIGDSQDCMIRIELPDHRNEPPVELVWLDGALCVRNPGVTPVRVGSKQVTQGKLCPLAGGDLLEVGHCELEVSAGAGAAGSLRPSPAAAPEMEFEYSGPGGKMRLGLSNIAQQISADTQGEHYLWQAGWPAWKPWKEVPEVVEIMFSRTGKLL